MADPVSTALSLAQLIVPSVEPVIRRLIEERRERKQMEKGLGKEIQRLFSNLQDLKDLLHDADNKQYQSESLRTWLMKLKEVVSDADDVLDEYATDLAILQMEGGSQLLNPDGWRVKVPDYCFNARAGKTLRPFGRLWWDEIVPTVLTSASPHYQVTLHPEQDRTLTIRENARLQGFPDYYRFHGTVRERRADLSNELNPDTARSAMLWQFQ